MRNLLFASTALTLLAFPAFASVGGDDGFGGDETSTGSSFGNGSGDYGSATQTGNDGYSPNTNVDRLAGIDRPNGDVDLYNVNPFHRTLEFLGTSDDGWGNYDMDITSGFGGRSVQQALADRQAREAPKPTPRPEAPPAPAPAPQVDMGSIGTAVIELQPAPTPQAIIPDPVDVTLEGIKGLVVNDQHGALTQEQKRVAAALNLGAGALIGRGARGNHRLAQITGRPKMLELNQAEGAIIGAAVAETRRQVKGEKTPFDDFVRSLTEFSNADFNRARRELARQFENPERRERFLSETKSIRETQERKERDDKRGDRKGGRGKAGRGNPDY